MFLLNVGYGWKVATTLDAVNGAVFLPCSNSSARLLRAPQPEFHRVLLDPQLYLAGLDASKCVTTCARLAGYPWFGVSDMPEFDSSSTKRRDWEKEMQALVIDKWPQRPPEGEDVLRACMSAIQTQLSCFCTHVILPSPLVAERENEAETQAVWLDNGLEAAEELEIGQPLLATVALADTVVNEEAFAPASFLDTVVDQVASREGIDGVYIVIAQAAVGHPFDTVGLVNCAYLHLSRAFARRGYDIVLTNFADVFGLACIGAGATGLATGPSHSLRRLSLQGFHDEGGGKAFPHLYSHQVVAEVLSETGLDKIAAHKLLGRVRDVTVHSEGLFEELERGGTAANLPGWAESQNNLGTAQNHFITRLVTEEARLSALSPGHRPAQIREWLEVADANMMLVRKRVGDDYIGHTAPVDSWLDGFDKVVG